MQPEKPYYLYVADIISDIQQAPHKELQERFTTVVTPEYKTAQGLDFDELDFSYKFDSLILGDGKILFYPQKKEFVWFTFYPFGQLDEPTSQKEIKGHHLGTLATYQTMSSTLHLYPDITPMHTVSHAGSISEKRKKQLSSDKIGIDYRAATPVGDYMEKLVNFGNNVGFEFKNPFI